MREFWAQYHASLGGFFRAIRAVLSRGREVSDDIGTTDLDTVFLFAGVFDSEAEMFAYCFTPIRPNGPEQINIDLPEAPINTDLIEAVWSDQIRSRLSEYFGRKERRRILARLSPRDALVMIPVQTFDGLPFHLHDTQRLRYLGSERSLARASWALSQDPGAAP